MRILLALCACALVLVGCGPKERDGMEYRKWYSVYTQDSETHPVVLMTWGEINRKIVAPPWCLQGEPGRNDSFYNYSPASVYVFLNENDGLCHWVEPANHCPRLGPSINHSIENFDDEELIAELEFRGVLETEDEEEGEPGPTCAELEEMVTDTEFYQEKWGQCIEDLKVLRVIQETIGVSACPAGLCHDQWNPDSLEHGPISSLHHTATSSVFLLPLPLGFDSFEEFGRLVDQLDNRPDEERPWIPGRSY